jgi:hypothetical protein
MNIKEVYFENFSISTCVLALFTNRLFRKSIVLNLGKIYYFDSGTLSKNILTFIFALFKVKVFKLKFKMLDVLDKNGELTRIRISRVDLYDLQKDIESSDFYASLGLNDSTSRYIMKEICNDGINDYASSARALYIIQVVSWHRKKYGQNNTRVLFFVDKRNWFRLYKENAKKYNINLITYHIKKNRISKVDLIKALYGYPKVYRILKKITLYVKN